MSNPTTFGQWLKQRRKALGLTQKELARRAGCAEITLRKIEAGDLHASAPLVASLTKVAGAADADLPNLLSLARGAGDDFTTRARLLRPQRANNLPAQLTPLIGREHDIVAVRKRLLSDGARLVTLLGPPGVGKTRLALAVAEDVLEHFEHGAFFVRLGPVSDPTLVAAAIAQALSMEMSGPNPPALQLRASLEEKHLLLVLDNFEQIIAAAPLVDDLLRRCPWLHVLVTSRQPLRVRGERQVTVHPLPLPTVASKESPVTAEDMLRYPAVALFADRAEAVQADFAVSDDNAAAVAELCRRLDGLPLAIELVAARVKLLPPAELLARLRGPWLLSADGLRDVSERQRTLRGAIGWSYDLLPQIEQTLFTRLAVFVGGCTLEAAEMMCEDVLSPAQVLDGIASLLDKNLLHRQAGLYGETRYAMLETVREYGLEQLAYRGDEGKARRRHLDGCRAVTRSAAVAPFVIFNQIGWLQLDAEIHNVRAGLNWALEHDPTSAVELVLATSRYLANRGLVDEAIAWAKQALDVASAGATPGTYAELLFCLGTAQFLAVYHEHAERSMIELLELSQELGLALGKAGALYYLGRIAAYSGNSFQAEAYLEGALKVYQEAGAAANVDYANILSVLAEIVMFRGDLARSRTLHTQALAGSLPQEQRGDVIWSLGGLADVAFLEGDLPTARRLAEEFLVICRQRRNPAEIAWAMTCLGEIAIRAGDFAAAHTYLEEALLLKPISDSAWRVPIVEAALGDLALAKGQHELALRLYRASLPILAQRGIYAHPQGSLRLACLASALDHHEVAATLLAACSAAVERGVEVLFPITQADFGRALAASQTALDADTFEDAWATGRSLSPHAAVARGLQAIHVSE